MRTLILFLILSVALLGKESINIYYAQKRPNSTEVRIPLDGFTGEKKATIHKFLTDVTFKLNSGEELPIEEFKKNTTTTNNPHWNNDSYNLIGDNAVFFENITGFSIDSPLVSVLISPDGVVNLDTIEFYSFELYFFRGAAGQGWEVTSKFKVNRFSKLYSQGSDRNIPLFACPTDKIAQPLRPKQVAEVDVPVEVMNFHDENTKFKTAYWKNNEAYITKGTSYNDWISTQSTRVVQKLYSISVYLGKGHEPWYLSLCVLPSYETYSQATVLDKNGKILVDEIATMHGAMSNCYGTIPLQVNYRVSEAIVCRVNAKHGNSYLKILIPTIDGRFDEIFSYWDIRD